MLKTTYVKNKKYNFICSTVLFVLLPFLSNEFKRNLIYCPENNIIEWKHLHVKSVFLSPAKSKGIECTELFSPVKSKTFVCLHDFAMSF